MNFKSFEDVLLAYPVESIVFVGLGNSMRSDDRAGLVLLRNLKQCKSFHDARFIEAGANPENYLQAILDLNPMAVVFIDTARFGQPPGTIQWLTRQNLDQMRISTHAFSLTLVEDYIRTHQEVDFHYLGIEPESTVPGTELSAVVQNNLDMLLQLPEAKTIS